jgi:hypothetical protein
MKGNATKGYLNDNAEQERYLKNKVEQEKKYREKERTRKTLLVLGVIPGLGLIYVGKWILGIIVFFVTSFSYLLVISGGLWCLPIGVMIQLWAIWVSIEYG